MRFKYKFAMVEYEKIKKYLEKNGYRCEVTGSLRRKNKDVGDIDVVVTDKIKSFSKGAKLNMGDAGVIYGLSILEDLEDRVLKVVSKYCGIESRINKYEFILRSGISIHMIPEISTHFNYTLWHSTGSKLHIKLIKNLYKERNIEIQMENILEEEIYTDIGIKYLNPEERYKLTSK